MPDVFVAKISDLPDGERRIVAHGTEEIGVFHWQGAPGKGDLAVG